MFYVVFMYTSMYIIPHVCTYQPYTTRSSMASTRTNSASYVAVVLPAVLVTLMGVNS